MDGYTHIDNMIKAPTHYQALLYDSETKHTVGITADRLATSLSDSVFDKNSPDTTHCPMVMSKHLSYDSGLIVHQGIYILHGSYSHA